MISTISDEDLEQILKTVHGEDDPGPIWFIETIEELVNEIKRVRGKK